MTHRSPGRSLLIAVAIVLATAILCTFCSKVLKTQLKPLALLVAHTVLVVVEASRKAMQELSLATALPVIMYSIGFAWLLKSPGKPPLAILAMAEMLAIVVSIVALEENAWHVSVVEMAWAAFGLYHLTHAVRIVDDARERSGGAGAIELE